VLRGRISEYQRIKERSDRDSQVEREEQDFLEIRTEETQQVDVFPYRPVRSQHRLRTTGGMQETYWTTSRKTRLIPER
jgi:hypothetical protein